MFVCMRALIYHCLCLNEDTQRISHTHKTYIYLHIPENRARFEHKNSYANAM